MKRAGARRIKVVFFAEAVTLAHMARPAVLAQALDPERYDVVLASHPRYLPLFGDLGLSHIALDSISPERFLAALAKGKPLYEVDTLESYVIQDLEIIDREKPDVVVGDFRLSLSVSARLRQVPYIALANAYWSPYAEQDYPIPEHSLVNTLGLKLAQRLFDLVRPFAFGMHCRPMNTVRNRHGLSLLGRDLRRVYTDSDILLYADIPELVSMPNLPSNHHFIGPIFWSPAQSEPSWWREVDESKPNVYLSLGSSGRSDILPSVVEALLDLPVNLLVATAGRAEMNIKAENLYVASYLPGEEAAARSRVVISNGGSLTSYQALRYGVPVLGIAGNLDQHLNMSAVERLGAGIRMRTDRLEKVQLQESMIRLLEEAQFAQGAAEVQQCMLSYNPVERFEQILRAL